MKVTLVLASALLQPAPVSTPTEPYRCSVPIEVAGLSGAMWRDFGMRRPDDFYIMQLNPPEPGTGPRAIWSIDNRPPAPPRRYGWQVGRPEGVVFRQGPDSVSFGTIETGEIPSGALWVHLYGDGAYAGTVLQQSARQTRRATRYGARAVSLFASQGAAPEAFARLASAREWLAVLVDSSGRELGRSVVTVPTGAEIQREFERARTALLRNREEFLAHPTYDEDAPCAFFPPEGATI